MTPVCLATLETEAPWRGMSSLLEPAPTPLLIAEESQMKLTLKLSSPASPEWTGSGQWTVDRTSVGVGIQGLPSGGTTREIIEVFCSGQGGT